ncbi:MAG TPA: hypothetical protein VGD40_13960 [Chryseosolibacter sp.]
MKTRPILFFLLIAVAACTKEEPLRERPYAILETLDFIVTPTSSQYRTIEFRAKIEYAPGEILDHGFKWSASDPKTGALSNIISFGPIAQGTGKSFSHVMSVRIPQGSEFHHTMRAYARTKDHIFYGEAQYFCCR